MVSYLTFQGNLLVIINQSSLWMPKVGIFILLLYLLTFRVILLGMVSSGSLGCLNNFSPEVLLLYNHIMPLPITLSFKLSFERKEEREKVIKLMRLQSSAICFMRLF